MFREDLNIVVCVMTQIVCVTSEQSLNVSVQFSPLKKKDIIMSSLPISQCCGNLLKSSVHEHCKNEDG